MPDRSFDATILLRGEQTAISIHVYGTGVTRIGSSARRYYD